jgi:hypothetical protein
MAAEVIDHLWGMRDPYDAVTRHAAEVSAKTQRDAQIAKLREN